MSKVIGYTIRDISIVYSIGYVTCSASNIPVACAFAWNIFGLDLRHCLRILMSEISFVYAINLPLQCVDYSILKNRIVYAISYVINYDS